MDTKHQAEQFRGLLEQKGLKYTYERKFIFEEVLRIKSHFDADSLYERFKKKGLRIARDTVYRTIPLLWKAGPSKSLWARGNASFSKEPAARATTTISSASAARKSLNSPVMILKKCRKKSAQTTDSSYCSMTTACSDTAAIASLMP